MSWLLLGIAVAVASLVVLAVVLLSLWRRTRSLMRAVSAAGETLAASTDALTQLQTPAASGRGPRKDT
jgi:CHASE3 domain sensor protein